MKRLLLIVLSALIAFCCFVSIAWDTAQSQQEITILLSDSGIQVNGGEETSTIFTSHDIIYYEDRDTYSSGRIYGEGLLEDRHSTQEAQAHTVVNITAPGTYRLTGTMSAGQIRVDLGEEAYYDPKSVVNLILDNADITCSVAPAILFLHAYECDNHWSEKRPSMRIDTTQAGVNLILEGENRVHGSYVAKIYKDTPRGKKLWKQDGAISSYVTMNVKGSGKLDLIGDLEGISSELHISILGGDITIQAWDDALNANEDGVSVIQVEDGYLRILSGMQESEGDGIDSNGYVCINGGTVISWAPHSDAPLDGDCGVFINGGTVIGIGSNKDLAQENPDYCSINLSGEIWDYLDSTISVIDSSGKVVLSYDPMKDDFIKRITRPHSAIILSNDRLTPGETYQIQLNAELSGEEYRGLYHHAEIVKEGIPLINLSHSSEAAPTDFYMWENVPTYSIALPSEP